jgi:hypothetical protein
MSARVDHFTLFNLRAGPVRALEQTIFYLNLEKPNGPALVDMGDTGNQAQTRIEGKNPTVTEPTLPSLLRTFDRVEFPCGTKRCFLTSK